LIVICGDLKTQPAGCAFDRKAKGSTMNIKPSFFKALCTLL